MSKKAFKSVWTILPPANLYPTNFPTAEMWGARLKQPWHGLPARDNHGQDAQATNILCRFLR